MNKAVKRNMVKQLIIGGIYLLALIIFVSGLTLFFLAIRPSGADYVTGSDIAVLIISGVAIVLLLAALAANLAASAAFKKRYASIDMRKERGALLGQKQRLEENYKSEFIKVLRLAFVCRAYFIALNMLLALVIFFLFYCGIMSTILESDGYSAACVPGIILIALFQYQLINKYFYSPESSEPDNTIALTSETAPNTYSIIATVMQKAGLQNFEINVIPGFNTGIFYTKGKHMLCPGCYSLRAFSPDELAAVITHEAGHAAHGDLTATFKSKRTADNFVRISDSPATWKAFFSALGFKLGKEFQVFEWLSSMRKELAADEFVRKHSDIQAYINASAKAEMLGLYFAEPDNFNLFQVENPPENYFGMIYDDFIKTYAGKKKLWREICFKQTPPRLDTHPSFVERLRASGLEDFATDFDNNANSAETDELLRRCNIFFEMTPEKWTELRAENYLEPQKTIAGFEANGAENDDLLDVAAAYHKLCRYDDERKILDGMLEKNPDDTEALFRKGMLLCGLYEPECVELIIKAIENNTNHIEPGLRILGEYLLKMGMKDKKDELEEWVFGKMNKLFNIVPQYEPKLSDNFLPTALPLEIQTEIIELIKQLQPVEHAYLIKKSLTDGSDCNIVAIKFRPDDQITVADNQTANDACSDTYHKIWRNLDLRQEQFFLQVLNGEPRLEAKFHAAPGSKIV